jgi:cytosine/creatinine deaminase
VSVGVGVDAWQGVVLLSAREGAVVDRFMEAAIDEAHRGLDEGGIPVGAVLVRNGRIVGRGRNGLLQHGDPTEHAEMACLRDAGRSGLLPDAVLYTTMSPCIMCAGAMVQLGVRRVVIGECKTYAGAVSLLTDHGVDVVDLDLEELKALLDTFITEHPELWREAASLA